MVMLAAHTMDAASRSCVLSCSPLNALLSLSFFVLHHGCEPTCLTFIGSHALPLQGNSQGCIKTHT